MPNYVVALKRGFDPEDENYLDSISTSIGGVRLKGAANARRILVEMTPETASEISRRFGDHVNVEPEILYKLA
jgi:hypothetical protein